MRKGGGGEAAGRVSSRLLFADRGLCRAAGGGKGAPLPRPRRSDPVPPTPVEQTAVAAGGPSPRGRLKATIRPKTLFTHTSLRKMDILNLFLKVHIKKDAEEEVLGRWRL